MVSEDGSGHDSEQVRPGFVRSLRLLVELTRPHRAMFAVAVSGAFVYAVCTVASSFAVSTMVDDVIIPGLTEAPSWESFMYGAALIIGIGLLRAVGVVVRRSFAGVTQWWTVKTLAMSVSRKISAQPPQWHRSHMTGDVIARAGVDTEAATAVLAPLPFGTSVIVLLVVSGVWLVVTDPVMGLVALVVLPVLVSMNVVYHRLVERHYADAQHHLGEFSEAVYESLEGLAVIKAFGAETRETARLAGISQRLRDARSKAVRIRANFEGLLDALPSLVNVLLLIVGAYRVQSGYLSVGEVSGFIYLFTLLVFPLRIIGYVLSEVPHSLSGWNRIQHVINEPTQPNPKSLLQQSANEIGLRLTNVSFGYPGSSNRALQQVSLEVPVGSIAALVGPTGSGKSSLLRVITGNVCPDEGVVEVQSTHMSVVLQDSFLFSGSIRENVTMGTPVSDAEVWEALRVADLDDFVRSLPEHIHTEVGERGVSLSGGQRQRLALARAIAHRAPLLVMDDTTSALDPKTEATVLGNLAALEPRRTVVIVAARPSAVALAGMVLYLADGRLVDSGTPDELLQRNKEYRELIASYAADRHDSPEVGQAIP